MREDFDAAAYRCISIEGGCLRSLAIPFGHLRDLIAFVGSHCLPVGYFTLRDFGTRFVGRLWTLELVRLVPLNVLDC